MDVDDATVTVAVVDADGPASSSVVIGLPC